MAMASAMDKRTRRRPSQDDILEQEMREARRQRAKTLRDDPDLVAPLGVTGFPPALGKQILRSTMPGGVAMTLPPTMMTQDRVKSRHCNWRPRRRHGTSMVNNDDKTWMAENPQLEKPPPCARLLSHCDAWWLQGSTAQASERASYHSICTSPDEARDEITTALAIDVGDDDLLLSRSPTRTAPRPPQQRLPPSPFAKEGRDGGLHTLFSHVLVVDDSFTPTVTPTPRCRGPLWSRRPPAPTM